MRAALLEWFAHHQRILPWRENRTPYTVWVSEIMLQQTQVGAVRPYFDRFIARFPTLRSLAEAPDDAVLQTWAGLGYYSRAKNLHRAAKQVIAQWNGELPSSVEDLLKLPGIGRYTAGAIASLAFDRPSPILDGNVMRVLSRILEMRGDPREGQANALLWKAAEHLVQGPRPGALNESLMELGALVCIPSIPRCHECPVSQWCLAFKHGSQNQFPERKPPPVPEERAYAALIVRCHTRVLMRHLKGARIWEGLWAFPTDFPGDPDLSGPAHAAQMLASTLGAPAPYLMGAVRHGVMNWRIRLYFYQADLREQIPAPPDCAWVELENLEQLALPSPHRRMARSLQPAAGRLDL